MTRAASSETPTPWNALNSWRTCTGGIRLNCCLRDLIIMPFIPFGAPELSGWGNALLSSRGTVSDVAVGTIVFSVLWFIICPRGDGRGNQRRLDCGGIRQRRLTRLAQYHLGDFLVCEIGQFLNSPCISVMRVTECQLGFYRIPGMSTGSGIRIGSWTFWMNVFFHYLLNTLHTKKLLGSKEPVSFEENHIVLCNQVAGQISEPTAERNRAN